jgi:chromosome segregation protein
VLQARPEDRRGFVEEAAGVLKHRKRKEKALRKLDAMSANLARLQDLTAELRRQLKPSAGRRRSPGGPRRCRPTCATPGCGLLADDLVELRAAFEAEVRDETAVRERRALVEADLTRAAAREAELERRRRAGAGARPGAGDVVPAVGARGAAARHGGAGRRAPRHLDRRAAEQLRPAATRAGRARGAGGAGAGGRARRPARADRRRLDDAVTARTDAEARWPRRSGRWSRAPRGRRPARGAGPADRARSGRCARGAAAQAELGRLAARSTRRGPAGAAQAELAALEEQAGGLDAGEQDLDDRHERALAALAAAQERRTALQAQEREAERERSTWTARREALALSLARDGAAALVETGPGGRARDGGGARHGATGHEQAVAAALGAAADAVAVASAADAAAALARLKADDAGRAGLVVAAADARAPERPALDDATVWASELVTGPAALQASLARALADVVVVPTLDDARALVAAHPDLRAVTADGDLLGAAWAVGGSPSAPSQLEVQAAVDEATAAADAARSAQERLRFELAAVRADVERLSADAERSLAALHASDATMAALAEQLGLAASAARAAEAEAGRLEQARVRAEQARDQDLSGLAELEQRLAAAEAAPAEAEPSTDLRDRLAAAATAARATELEARLAVRTGEERARALGGRAEALERTARQERAARERLVRVRAQRERAAAVAAQVVDAAHRAQPVLAASLATATAEREAAAAARTVTEGELLDLRARTRELSAEVERLTDAVHRDEVARAEQRLRIERSRSAPCRSGACPSTSCWRRTARRARPGPRRGRQHRRAGRAGGVRPGRRRSSGRRGRARPGPARQGQPARARGVRGARGALGVPRHPARGPQGHPARPARHRAATSTRASTRSSRARSRTPPGVRARLRDAVPRRRGSARPHRPADLLTTGIEVLARPAGKKVSRLSLLSGGERSLTAIAFLVALFRARPSPFYVMDEVEAALDDRNLGRLLELLDELRSASQLIVITHQKRTMEIADALYGVTMRGDGISTVVSQRLRERETA